MTSTCLGPGKYKSSGYEEAQASSHLVRRPGCREGHLEGKSQMTSVSKPHLQEPGLGGVGKVLNGVDRLFGPQLGAVLAFPLPAHLLT